MTKITAHNSTPFLLLAAVLETMKPYSISRREAISSLVSSDPDLCYMTATLKYDSQIADDTTNLEMLSSCGIQVEDPSDIPPDEISIHLTHLIHGMAALNVFIVNTNHLTDTELYEKLFKAANEVIKFLPPSEGVNEFIDFGWNGQVKGGQPAICNRDSTLPRPSSPDFDHVAT